MNQILIPSLCLISGIVMAILFFRYRLKKSLQDLFSIISEVQRSLAPNTEPAVAAKARPSGSFEELHFIEEQIAGLRNLKKEPVATTPTPQEDIKNADLKKQLENLLVVNELGQRVTSTLNVNDLFGEMYGTINSMMDAEVLELGVYYWKENRWMVLSSLFPAPKYQVEDEEYKNPMSEWALNNNREIFLGNAAVEYERYVFKPLTLPDGRAPLSVMTFPIYRNEKERGTLTIMSFHKQAFNEYHVEMIRSLLPYLAVALDNALVHQELIVMQNHLIHNEKMASIGQLTSGIAHEILNPLNFVNNFSEMSIELFNELQQGQTKEEKDELKTQLISNLEKINFHGSRAYHIVKNMMQLSRVGDGEKTMVNLNRLITEAVNISLEGYKMKVKNFPCRVELVLDPDLPQRLMVLEDFNRVMINMLANALYAVNEKLRKIQSSGIAEPLHAFEPEIIIRSSYANSIFKIIIRDNGTGIPEEILGKIFLPFFTTKPTGEGTGLGLSISHDIITKGNGGEISVLSEPGKWTEFTIKLPA